MQSRLSRQHPYGRASAGEPGVPRRRADVLVDGARSSGRYGHAGLRAHLPLLQGPLQRGAQDPADQAVRARQAAQGRAGTLPRQFARAHQQPRRPDGARGLHMARQGAACVPDRALRAGDGPALYGRAARLHLAPRRRRYPQDAAGHLLRRRLDGQQRLRHQERAGAHPAHRRGRHVDRRSLGVSAADDRHTQRLAPWCHRSRRRRYPRLLR